ncbi:MAG: hypothetical protein IKB93_16635 [Clostridia bacterium]|nr:hypothetical protein [Clostridia bacterium]
MKKVSYKRLSVSLIITFLMALVPSCFESLQAFEPEKAELMLGFPFDFYMIKYVADKFAIHFNIAGFAANIIVTYLIITLLARINPKRAAKD